MAKFLSRLFSGGNSSKQSSFHGSQPSINDRQQRTGAGTTMRSASSLDNLVSYQINAKELQKNKLHKASWEGDLHKVERLVRPNSIDRQDQQSRTPLHLAVARGHLSIVNRLVHEGAKLNIPDGERRTPLLKAVVCSSQNPPLFYQICIILLQGGADTFVNAVDIHGKNALHYSVELQNESFVDLFLSLKHCDQDFCDRDQMTPLHLAVKVNNPSIAQLLLSENHECQADPNRVNTNGQTPLHMAASLGYTEIVRILLQSDLIEPCNPTILDGRQLTAYQLALENHHEPCAKLIDDYQKGWTKLSPRREISESINENEINPTVFNPAARFDDEDESSDSTSSTSNNRFSKPTTQQIHQPPNEFSDRVTSAANGPKQEGRSLADLIKNNPIQPEISKTFGPTPANQTLASLIRNNPLQAETSTKQPSSLPGAGITPTVHRRDSDTSTTSMTDKNTHFPGNHPVGQPSSPKKNVTINALVNALPHPEPVDSVSNSWTYDKSSSYKKDPIVKPANRVERSDDTSDAESENDSHPFRPKQKPGPFQPPPQFNVATLFPIAQKKESESHSESEDSIEAALQELNTQKASLGVQNLVNQQIGSSFKPTQQPPKPNLQSPTSEDYLWSSSSRVSNKEQPQGISALIKNQPLIGKKPNAPTWDDSRPLSADLILNSKKQPVNTSTGSSDSESEVDNKSSTIVRAPSQNPTLSSLIQSSMRPIESTETKSTGVENLIKIIEAIEKLPRPTQNNLLRPPPPQSTIGKLVNPAIVSRVDSLSSNASSMADDTVRAPIMPYVTQTNSKLISYPDDNVPWHQTTNDRNDLKHLTDKYNHDLMAASHRQMPQPPLPHDFNSLRGSMSSSTSSIQNNMDRLTELKEDIKQIERKQEDSLELKRQLKDMEIKKNNFEALYKKNDQLLQETEKKLEKEIGEKQRLEWATKNLNMELKSVKQKLQSLEEEKEMLNHRCLKLKEERDNYDEKLRIHQTNSLQAATAGVLREEDIEKIKIRHREEMKLLSAENEDLHQRTKQLQSDLQLHKESLDVTIRYKIDLEKALEEKTLLQHELDRLKHEKEFIEQEKLDYKAKYDNLQEEIRAILLDRSKLEQKLTNELQEQMKQRQRTTDDVKKYKAQIEQLNIKLGDAEARLLVLQTQNEALLTSKDREIKTEFDTLTHRLNMIESEKLNAEQRFHNEQRDIANKQQQQQSHVLHEPLVILTSPLSNALQQQQQHHHQHSPSAPCNKCDTLQRSYEQEREQRIQTEKDNERLRDVVSRQKQQNDLGRSIQQQQEYEHVLAENSKQIRSETERVKHELDRLRHDFDKLVSNYEPPNNVQQQAEIHSQIDSLRQFYEHEFRQKLMLSKLNNGTSPSPIVHNYHRTASPMKHDDYDHSLNGSANCAVCTNSRLLKERLENAIDTSLADQRIQAIKQMPILPRLASPLLPTNTNVVPSYGLLRKRYYV